MAAAVALAAALGCAHAPSPEPAGPPPAPPQQASAAPAPAPPPLALRAGAPTMLAEDASFQAPQLADPRCLEPELPAEARPPGPGAVVLRFGVAADASVDDLTVVANTTGGGAPTLDALADAVKACRWIPARSPQGRRVRVFVEERFEFVAR
ncbi:MAG TPA: hypothetical protein VFP65_09640 [Anaeromyxobacteraceae bacterium]|nr:hypothetical protein [Anaeromyxobacteraceae bacterium]